MEEKELNENVVQGEGTKEKKRYNDGPNYKKGKRLKLFRLLMYAGIVPSSSLALVNDKETYIKRKAYLMAKEGTLIKEQGAGEYVYRIKRMPKDVDLEELKSACPDTYDFYKNNAKLMMQRIKGITWSGDVKTMFRRAETIIFCDRLPVAYMLEEKTSFREKFIKNDYFTSTELRSSNKGNFEKEDDEEDLNKDKFPAGGTRNNGVIFSEGGVYTIYNYSKWSMEFKGMTETYMLDYVKNVSYARDLYSDVAAMFLYRTERVLREMIKPVAKYAKSISKITDIYDFVYALPLTVEGQQLAAFMCRKGWREKLMKMFRIQTPASEDGLNTDYLYRADGISVDANGSVQYVILFAIPNIRKITKVLEEIGKAKDRSCFVVRCFDFQEEFVKSLMPEGVTIQTASFSQFMKHLQREGE